MDLQLTFTMVRRFGALALLVLPLTPGVGFGDEDAWGEPVLAVILGDLVPKMWTELRDKKSEVDIQINTEEIKPKRRHTNIFDFYPLFMPCRSRYPKVVKYVLKWSAQLFSILS